MVKYVSAREIYRVKNNSLPSVIFQTKLVIFKHLQKYSALFSDYVLNQHFNALLTIQMVKQFLQPIWPFVHALSVPYFELCIYKCVY